MAFPGILGATEKKKRKKVDFCSAHSTPHTGLTVIGAGTSTYLHSPRHPTDQGGRGGADVDFAKAHRLQDGIMSVERKDISDKG